MAEGNIHAIPLAALIHLTLVEAVLFGLVLLGAGIVFLIQFFHGSNRGGFTNIWKNFVGPLFLIAMGGLIVVGTLLGR